MNKNVKDIKNNKYDKSNESIINIEKYLWNKNPETLIKLKNMFSYHKVKIVKDK